jgi:hypothetical protein
MKPYELFDLIRLNNPNELELKHTLRFRRRSRSNPCSFDDLLQALQSNESIHTVRCQGKISLGITEEEWFLLVQTLGTILGLRQLSFLGQDVPNVPPVQAVADAVGSARLLRKLVIGEGVILFGSRAGFVALCHNIGSCCLELEQVEWQGKFRSTWENRENRDANNCLDPLLQALAVCPRLQRVRVWTDAVNYVTPQAVRELLVRSPDGAAGSPSPGGAVLECLDLKTTEWEAVAEQIGQDSCRPIKTLQLSTLRCPGSGALSLARAVGQNRHLQSLTLRVGTGFTDAVGVALAQALQVNTTLRELVLMDQWDYGFRTTDHMNVSAYQAMRKMLRVNTNVVLKLPDLDSGWGSSILVDTVRPYYDQVRIEMRLNAAGRGGLMLVGSQASRAAWINTLYELIAQDDEVDNDIYGLKVDCLYTLLKLNPSLCQLD